MTSFVKSSDLSSDLTEQVVCVARIEWRGMHPLSHMTSFVKSSDLSSDVTEYIYFEYFDLSSLLTGVFYRHTLQMSLVMCTVRVCTHLLTQSHVTQVM